VASPLSATGTGTGVDGRVIGRVARRNIDPHSRENIVRVVARHEMDVEPLTGYAAVLFEGPASSECDEPFIQHFESLAFLKDDYVAVVEPHTGLVRVLYRADSQHNFLFATERCSSYCVMCSQPPRDIDDSGAAEELLRIVELIPDQPQHLGITGGEPTLLADGLVQVIRSLRDRLPGTAVTMLSNARLYCYRDFVAKLADIAHPSFVTSVPLHGSEASTHDFVAQARGAFDQTVQGLYNAARCKLGVELRVVLHRPTITSLESIVEFIYRDLPFVQHVALMGLEPMGFARTHRDPLWVDPADYVSELEHAVQYLMYRRVPVSLYNLPLCVLPKELWGFARQSISDYKNIFLGECSNCRVRAYCSGFFQSVGQQYSRSLHAVL
jgi:His-Xaa-Ser system radical SAM maturase HxsC